MVLGGVEPEVTATLSMYGTDVSDKFKEYGIGDVCVFLVTGTLESLSKGSVSIEVTDVELKAHAENWDDAVKRAQNEVAYKNRIEPAVG